MRYNRKQVEQMAAEVTAAVDVLLKSEADTSVNPQTKVVKDLKKNNMPPEQTPSASASMPPPSEGSDSSSAGAPQLDASSSAPESAVPSIDELKAEYSQLSPEEFQAHAEAMAAVISEKQGGAPGADQGAPQPSAPPSGGNATLPGEGSPGTDPAMAMKSERIEADVNGLKKSLEEQKAINSDLKKSVDAVAAIMQKAFAPRQKAVTAHDAIPASLEAAKPLTKSEINAKINGLDHASLKKSDISAIKDFYNGKVQVGAISHLFK